MEHLSPVWSRLTHLQPERGSGIYLYDNAGAQYIDFTSGIGVVNTGHCHPRVVKAIQAQAERLLFGQMNIVVNGPSAQLASALNEITPTSIDRFFFANSGAEATEGAVKLARHATGKTNIIVFQGSFHGRTAQTMAMTTSKTVYRHKYQPLPGGIFVAPFPYTYYYQSRYGWDEAQTITYCLDQLELLLKSQSSAEETAAVVLEPVLGEGGYIPAPVAFLRALRQFCTDHHILFVADEVQTGFGRTGRMFGFEHADIVPDIIIMAKGLGSGLPISGIAASHELMERWQTGTHGGTYGGGSAIASAAAVATLQVMIEEDLPANAQRVGDYLKSRLETVKDQCAVIGDVRGRGLMIGVEFADGNGHPDKASTKAVQAACLERNLLLLTCGSYENVIRWIPPLIVTEAQVDEAVAIFQAALNTL
jgi:4-aminobutyrate aminotransferase